jgi:hypothetical protein
MTKQAFDKIAEGLREARDMVAADTSAEAVEQLSAEIYAETNNGNLIRWCPPKLANDATTTLRALLAERDALRAQASDILAENDALRFTLNNANAALATARAEGYAAGQEDMRERAAGDVDCGCENREIVMARLESQGARPASYLCHHGDVCCALQAAMIRDLRIKTEPKEPGA